MIENYTHQRKDIHKKISESYDKAPLTLARIIAFNNATINYLRSNNSCYGLDEIDSEKGLGLCNDIDNCKRDGTPIRFCCYFCKWFVPNENYLDAYKGELAYWNEKINVVNSTEYSGTLTVGQATEVRDKLASIIVDVKKRGTYD